jgi:hypothetical protein
MKTSQTGAITFEYGNFGVPLDPTAPNPNANTAVKVGDADSGSYNPATGEIRITVSNSKLENIQVGQSMTGMIVRTFLAKDPTQAKAVQSAADTTDPSHYDVVGNAACLLPVPLVNIVSRKTHTGVGPFDVNLPLISPFGIECRTGQPASGNHTIVFTFANPLTSVTSASVTSGTGSVSSRSIGTDAHEYIVNLSGVANAQNVTVTLTGISDTAGNSTPSLAVTMGVLLADVNANKVVSNTDVASVKGQVAAPVTSSNFRNDVNANGVISNTDVSTTKTQVGITLP